MKWVCAILFLIAVATVSASFGPEEKAFFDAYNSYKGKGACLIEYEIFYGSNVRSYQGYWPARSCQTIPAAGTEYDLDYLKLRIKRDISYNADIYGVFDHYVLYGSNWERTQLEGISPSYVNNFATQSLTIGGQSKQVVPLMTFGWCADGFAANFTSSTLTPSVVSKFYYTTNDGGVKDCPVTSTRADENTHSRTWENTLGTTSYADLGRAFYFSTQRGRNKAYTLPLTQKCSEYAIEIPYKDYDDTNWWTLPATKVPVFSAAQRTYQYAGSTDYGGSSQPRTDALGKNRLTVTLQENAGGFLERITIDTADLSDGNGGQLFTLYCVEPLDPDTDKNSCIPPFNWNDRVAAENPTSACCGDDATDTNMVAGDYKCDYNSTRTTQPYQWIHFSQYCTYPTGWRIDNSPATAAQAKLTYLDGSGSPALGCCSLPQNIGGVVNYTTDQAVCVRLPNNASTWVKASEQNIMQINGTNVTERRYASNGVRWLACQQPPLAPVAQQVRTTAPPIPAKEPEALCEITTCNEAEFGNCLESCPDIVLPPQYDNCDDYCAATVSCTPGQRQSVGCEEYSGTICQNNGGVYECICSSGEEWDEAQNKCVPYVTQCPQNYVASEGQCVNVTTQMVPAIAKFDSSSVCDTLTNLDKTSICLDDWMISTGEPYYLNDTNQSVNITRFTNLKQFVTQVCRNGEPIPAIRKDTPDKREYGFCDANQCFYIDRTSAKYCYDNDSYVWDNYCVTPASTTSAEWTSRTRLLADTLYEEAGTANFILHCDTDAEAINNFTNTTPYTRNYVAGKTIINSFCVLSNPDGKTIAIGTSLNTGNGTPLSTIDAVRFPIDTLSATTGRVPRFLWQLNNSDVKYGANHCDEAETDVSGNDYGRCDTQEGTIWYNPTYSLLLFSDQDFTPGETSWWEKVKGFFGASTPPSLIELSGNKIYVARSGNKMLQGVWKASAANTKTAYIAYQNIDTAALCQNSRATCTNLDSPGGRITTISITNPTQAEWEAYTLHVRPS
jgi:hypothetical protein